MQWRLATTTLQAFLAKLERCVIQAAGYDADLLIFPEFFNLGLLDSPLASVASMQALATHAGTIVARCSALAQQHRINIVAGSLPCLRDGNIFNVATFCHRDGSVTEQAKLHATPYEQREWKIQGGNTLAAFDTDIGRCGMLICYDVEFPELTRVLNEQQMDILLVPFWTDSLNAYHRVRFCAQARAIENECYVVIAGCCGAVPNHEVIDFQHAQSAIFTPSDFSFPEHATLAEARANEEMMIVTGLDLSALANLRESGSVQIGKNRRRDLYRVEWQGK